MEYNVIVSGISKCDYFETKSGKIWLFGCCLDSNYCSVLAKDYRAELNKYYQGCFAVVELRNSQLFIRTDSFGLGKIFYYIDDDEILVSDNIDCIVKSVDKELSVNYGACAEFLTFHYILGEKTFFNEISSLRINESFSVELQTGMKRQVFDDTFELIRKNKSSVSYSDAVDKTVELLTKALEKAIEASNKSFFPISGGYDSRCILGIANSLLCNVLSYTTDFDDGNNKDIIYGKMVAERLGVNHEYIPLSNDYYMSTLDEYLVVTNNCTNMYSALYAFYKKDFPYRGVTIFNGYGGDLLFRGLKQDLLFTEKDEFYRACFQRFKMNHKNATATKITGENVEKLAFCGLKRELELCNDDLLIFLFANRNRNNVAYDPYLISMKNQCVCPFLDRNVIEFAFSLPDKIRLSENFYIDILKSINPLLATTPGTNKDDNAWSYKPLIKESKESIDRFFVDSNQHWTKSRGLFSSELLLESCKNYDFSCKTNNEFQKIEIPWMLTAWLDRYDGRLRKDTILDFINKKEFGVEKYQAIEYLEPSERRYISKKWMDLWNAEKTGQEKLDVLLTMDVESYGEQDIYASHTAKDDKYNILFRGGEGDFAAVRKIINSGMKFTFFADIFNDSIVDSELKEVLFMCNQNGCEVGLHCHHFSLPKQFCEKQNIHEYYNYRDVLNKTISDGTKRLISISGIKPVSYRAGSFRIEEGHFEALKQNGFLVDSSSYMGNPYQSPYDCDRNSPVIMDGIFELPVSSCWDLTAGGRKKRFDLNTLQFEKKCELIVKSALSDNSYLMMLSHSWSFLDGIKIAPKIFHEAFSPNAWDELERIVDLIHGLGVAQFYTCHEYYKEKAETVINKKSDRLLDLTGIAEKPELYYLQPAYAGLRKIVSSYHEANELVNLSSGYLSDSKKSYANSIKVDQHIVQLQLQESAPNVGDWVMYQLDPHLTGHFHMFVSIACDYYKEKFVGRNSIQYRIVLDGDTLFQKFITDKDDNDLKDFNIELSEYSKITFVLECVKSEMPWHWNVASKTLIRGILFRKI